MGPNAARVARAFAARGQPIPADAIEPDLDPDARLAWRAFHDLAADRAVGFGGVAPLPWTAIDAWARRNDVPDFDEFLTLLRAADAVALERFAKDR